MQFIQAKHFRQGRRKKVRLIVIHDMEAPEKTTTAEAVARYFAAGTVVASAHVCVDSDSEVRCVKDKDTAFAAPPCNDEGLHIEHAGYARQSKAKWLDTYSRAMLRRSAKIVAAWCVKYDIPVVKLDASSVRAGKRGLCGHVEVTKAYHVSTHTDPGDGFPWTWYLSLVKDEVKAARKAKKAGAHRKPGKIVVKTTVYSAMRAAGLATTAAAIAAVLTANQINDPTKVRPGVTLTVPASLMPTSAPAKTPAKTPTSVKTGTASTPTSTPNQCVTPKGK